jgi:hypothetical protein
MRLGGDVVPIAVDTDPDATRRLCELWKQWDPGADLRVLPSPHRTLVAPAVGFVRTQVEKGQFVIVLLSYIEPRRGRYRILHNQRGPLRHNSSRTHRRHRCHASGSLGLRSSSPPTSEDWGPSGGDTGIMLGRHPFSENARRPNSKALMALPPIEAFDDPRS